MEVFDLQRVTGPDKALRTSYVIHSLLWGPAFFVPLILNLVRYRTLRFRFDEDGVTVMWGRLARREVTVSYQSIQDIHLQSDLVERWLGLARIEIQTASAEAKAEVILEGIQAYEEVRDALFHRMTRARLGQRAVQGPEKSPDASSEDSVEGPDLVALTATLNEVAQELRALRVALSRSAPLGRQPEKGHE